MIKLTKDLIKLNTNPGNVEELKKALDLCLHQLSGFHFERFHRNKVESLLIYNTKKRPKKFKVLLNGHLDVIPGKESQYNPVIKENKLYGVGSMDMKGNVACLVSSFKDIAEKVDYPLGLQLVTDEEVGGFDGTKYQIDEGVCSDFVIAGETTNFNIVNEAKGILWLKISTKGRTAHGAYPWRGENAIWKMQRFLMELQKAYPIPTDEVWKTSINLSSIETRNQSFNKIPDDCNISLDIRYLPEDNKTILLNIKSLLPKGFKLEVLVKEPPLYTSATNPYLSKLKKITSKHIHKPVKLYGAQGSSDARHFTQVGCPGIEFGPIGGGIGTDKEWISLNSMHKYREILNDFLLSLNSNN